MSEWPPGPARPPAPRAKVHVWRVELGEGRDVVREVLSRYLGAGPGAIALIAADGGKPRLADPEAELRFNLSHSGDLALVAVSAGREVGVDVERVEPGRDVVRLAQRWLGAEEAAAVRAAPESERDSAFYTAWTRHEATVKCLGTSVLDRPASRSISTCSLPIDAGHAATLAVDGADAALHRRFSLAPTRAESGA